MNTTIFSDLEKFFKLSLSIFFEILQTHCIFLDQIIIWKSYWALSKQDPREFMQFWGSLELWCINGKFRFERGQARLSFNSPSKHLHKHFGGSVWALQGLDLLNSKAASSRGSKSNLSILKLIMLVLFIFQCWWIWALFHEKPCQIELVMMI